MPSIPKPLLALVRPDRAFADWRPSFRVAAALVLLVAVANAAGVVLAADDVAATVTGTVEVENPERPPEQICANYEPGGPFEEQANSSGIAQSCRTQPRTVNVSLAGAAHDGVTSQVPGAFLGPVVGWLLVGAVGLLFVGDGVDGRYTEMLAVAGFGFLPAVVRYALRPLAVREAAAGWTYPTGSPEAVEAAARVLVAQERAGWFAVVVAGTLAWQAVVLAFGTARAADAPTEKALVAFGLPALVLAWFQWSAAGLHALPGAAILVAFLGLLGLAQVAIPRTLIQLQTTFELIGMRGREHVEPRGWYVWATRAFGTGFLVAAFVVAGGLSYG